MNESELKIINQIYEEEKLLLALYRLEQLNTESEAISIQKLNEYMAENGEAVKDAGLKLHQLAEKGFAPPVVQIEIEGSTVPKTLQFKLNETGKSRIQTIINQ